MINFLRKPRVSGPEPAMPAALLADLGAMYAATAPAREFDVAAAGAASVPALPGRRSVLRPVAMATGVAAVVAAAAFAIVPNLSGGDTETVSAAELLAKATLAVDQLAAGETSYYIERHSVIDGGSKPGNTQVSRLWSRDAAHWRVETDIIDTATGQPAPGTGAGLIRNGDEFWMLIQDGEILRVVNRSVAAMGSDRAPFLPPATLEQALKVHCDDGTVSDGELVAGRTTHRVECPVGYTIWLDKGSFIPLQVEGGERTSVSGTTVETMTVNVTTLNVNFDPIPDDVFDYKPPSGTWVNYQDRGEVIQVP